MTSQILSILIDSIQDGVASCTTFSIVFQTLNLNNSETKEDIKGVVNGNLSDF